MKLTDFWDQSWKATVIWCRQAPESGRGASTTRGCASWGEMVELDTGHYPMLSMPDELTQILTDG